MPDDLLHHLLRLSADDGDGGPAADAIADVLWMARYLQPATTPESLPPPEPEPAPPGAPPENPAASRFPQTDPEVPEPREFEFHPLSGDTSGGGSPAAPIRVPAVTALADKLEVSRSLRPLNRRVPARDRLSLAEDATAAAYGETRMILPVWRPATERWLQIDLVVDTSASMTIWQQTIAEFRALIEYLGAFRDVRTWAINGDDLHPRMTAFANPQAGLPAVPHSPAEFLDPGGRRAILVVTDAVGAAWHAGTMTRILATWARSCPLAINQVLPRRLWHRTALNPVKARMTHSSHPPFCAVRTDHAWAHAEGSHQEDGWVPVLHPSGEWLQPWAAMVAGAGEVVTDMFAIRVPRETPLSAGQIPAQRELPHSDASRKHLRRFLDREASPEAAELAGYLAAAPLTPPIMRLVQRAMLPHSGPEHLAEVFLSGLLVRASPVAEDTDPETIRYEFRDDFREQLLGGLTRSESLRVLEVLSGVSGIVADRFGGLLDFSALAARAAAGPRSLPPASLPFARIAAAVLRGLGGSYAGYAEALSEQAVADARAGFAGNGGVAARTTRASAGAIARGFAHAGQATEEGGRASAAVPAAASGYAQLPADALIRILTDSVAELGEHDTLTMAELTTAGIVAWEVRRDPAGTPCSRYWPATPWSAVYDDRGVLAEDRLHQAIRAGSGARIAFDRGSPGGPYATDVLEWLRYAYPATQAFQCMTPLDELLRQAIADTPLTRQYELVGLRQTRHGRLELTGCQLFPPGARRHDRRPFTIWCAPSDANGTVFAVVTADPERRFRLISVQSAKLAPGRYDLTAELRRPGLVRFGGLPAPLRTDRRSWPGLVAAMPEELYTAKSAHLICIVEVSGTRDQVLERLERIEQLMQLVAADAKDLLTVSLISYGPHSVDRDGPEVPLEVWTWAGSSDAALAALRDLRDRGPTEPGYPRAAQLECVLTEVADRLTGQEGRPVLVAVGSRPAFPRRVDPDSEIIPCPRRRDWRLALAQLRRRHPRITFGAIHDGADDEIWRDLGRHALVRVDVVDVRGFAADLDLLTLAARLDLISLTTLTSQPVPRPVPLIPFPLVNVEAD